MIGNLRCPFSAATIVLSPVVRVAAPGTRGIAKRLATRAQLVRAAEENVRMYSKVVRLFALKNPTTLLLDLVTTPLRDLVTIHLRDQVTAILRDLVAVQDSASLIVPTTRTPAKRLARGEGLVGIVERSARALS